MYNADRAAARGRKAPVDLEKEFVSWEYNDDGRVLWENGVQSLSWDKLNFNIGLKGLFSFDFGDIPFEKVRMGDLQNLKITLEGGFDTELVMKYAVASEVGYEKEWTLKGDVIPNLKYTFMVGTVPVYINVGADLMANVSLGASGEASITAGVKASNTVSYGVEWDAEKGLTKISECEKNMELVGPDVNIQAHAEARATVYPQIEIGIYKVEDGDEYEVYGRGTMKMHQPTITSFQAQTEKDWVKVGESTKVTLVHYYEENATWDWNDVQLIGQSTDYSLARNGEDEGFFSWDAATQTLTSLKSNDNKRVNVCLGLKSNPGVKHTLMVATGTGWKYTMIKTSVEELNTKQNSYPDFSMDWAPKDSDDEKFDFTSVELDPESVPAGCFQFPTSYANQGWPVWVSSNCPPGDYTLRIRLKSDHSVNCTQKITVTASE